MASVRTYLESMLARMGVADWLLVALGLVLIGLGLWALRWARQRVDALAGIADGPSGEGGAAAGSPDRAGADGAAPPSSPASRYTLGVGLLVLGYHAVAWGLPPDVVVMRWSEQWWWVLVLLVVGLVGLARWMDRWDGLPR